MPSDKATIQDEQYSFPYHYLPELQGDGTVTIHRHLYWGLDYLTYMTFLSEKVSELKPESLLDVGCGDGRFYGFVKGAVETYKGVDLSTRAISWARCFNPGIDFAACDCGELGDTYDAVTLIETLEHIPDSEVESFVNSIRNLVKPGGIFLVSVPSVNIPLNPKHYRHYDESLLRDHLGKYFDVDSVWWIYRQGMTEWILRHLMVNKVFILNHRKLRKFLWGFHRKHSYMAERENGTHIVCLARPKVA